MATSADPLSDLLRGASAWGPVARLLRWAPMDRLQTWARIDFEPRHRQPRWSLVGIATVLAIVLSLAADAALVALGTHLYPALKGYSHFRFSDYAKLTVVGVLIGCVAWPVVTRISSAPRWLFFRLAVLVTLVLWIPDLWIWHKGQPAHGVAVLMVMHVAIALITYNLLVHVAPVRLGRAVPGTPGGEGAPAARRATAS